MIFPSYAFLLVFLPAALAGWYLLPTLRMRLVFLTAASYVFYGWWDYRFVVLMAATTLLDYICGLRIHRSDVISTRRRWLAVSIVGNLGSLGFFKYYGFFVSSAHAALSTIGLAPSFPILELVLPLGISFYTFQSMSYSIDIYRGQARPSEDFLRFAAYVSMFPQLVAGPIVRYGQIEEQLAALEDKKASFDQIADGVWLFVIGLVKKIWIADLLAPVVAYAFDQGRNPQLITAWVGALSYAFQLYFDFSGYSDMARGLGRMLGFEFPVNFDSPYKAADISAFWTRWHVTLSQWLRDYLYIPLGGSRHGTARTLRNLAITMFLGGLWHGAAWTFVVWGIYHGCLLMAHAVWVRVSSVRLPRLAGVALTFLTVTLGWVVFRANSIGEAVEMWTAMLGLNGVEPFVYSSHTLGLRFPAIYGEFYGARGVAILAVIAAVAFVAPNSDALGKPRHPAWGVALAGVTIYTMTGFMREIPFLYFTF